MEKPSRESTLFFITNPRRPAIWLVSAEASMAPPLRDGRWSEWAWETKLMPDGSAVFGSRRMRLWPTWHRIPFLVMLIWPGNKDGRDWI